MMKNEKIINLKKWILLIFFTFLFSVLQNTEIFAFIFNTKPTLVFPFAICCALFLKREEAIIFSVICGFFLDCYLNIIFGFSSIILLFFATFTATFIRKYVKICLINIIILNLLLFLIYSFLVFTFKYLILDFDNVFKIWLFDFMPNIIYTTMMSIFIFLISKNICYNSKTRPKIPKEKKQVKVKKYEQQ